MNHALIGTRRGLYRLDGDTLEPLGLDQFDVSAVYTRTVDSGASLILAGTYGDGLLRSTDEGVTWDVIDAGLTAPAFRTIVPDPLDPAAILCGTEPGRIFRSIDEGMNWTEYDAIPDLPHAQQWFLPYSPRAGAVRNIHVPSGTKRILASVEVGGLLDSPDQGAIWTSQPILGDTDIHFVTSHPNDPNLLFAALGWATLTSVPVPPDSPSPGGVARSRDGGQTWEKLFTDYTRAVIVPPSMPDLVLAGPATAVGGPGRIEVSHDAGDSWSPAGDGVDMPMEDMIELFEPAPDGSIWAMRSGGGLIRAEPGEWRWHSVLPAGVDISVRSIAFT